MSISGDFDVRKLMFSVPYLVLVTSDSDLEVPTDDFDFMARFFTTALALPTAALIRTACALLGLCANFARNSSFLGRPLFTGAPTRC